MDKLLKQMEGVAAELRKAYQATRKGATYDDATRRRGYHYQLAFLVPMIRAIRAYQQPTKALAKHPGQNRLSAQGIYLGYLSRLENEIRRQLAIAGHEHFVTARFQEMKSLPLPRVVCEDLAFVLAPGPTLEQRVETMKHSLAAARREYVETFSSFMASLSPTQLAQLTALSTQNPVTISRRDLLPYLPK